MSTIDLAIAVKDSYLGAFTTAFDGDTFWQLVCGFLVFFMHAGFAMLEAGSIADRHKVNVLFKNVSTVVIGGLAYFIVGYGFAYGDGDNNSFIGGDSYFGTGFEQNLETGDINRIEFFFQWAFCITAATIVSGAVAGRMKIEAFLILATVLTAVVYPVVTHFAWSGTGILSAFKGDDVEEYFLGDVYANACGVFDFAGSGVVHLTGGVAALIAAIILGPRNERFGEGNIVNPMPGHNLSIATLGTFILWFGWFGFNCGSTLAFDGLNASKVAVTTAISPATACITSIIVQKYRTGKYDLPGALNAILAGLVSITAGCSTVSDFAAIPIGFIGALLYIWSSEALLRLKIDDPIGAAPVHGFCGIWGVVAVGIFATPSNINNAYACPVPLENSPNADWLEPPPGYQMFTQIVLVVAVTGWVALTVTPLLYLLKRFNYLRVSLEEEIVGLDKSEHGVVPYAASSGTYGTEHEDEDIKKIEKEAQEASQEASQEVAVQPSEEEGAPVRDSTAATTTDEAAEKEV